MTFRRGGRGGLVPRRRSEAGSVTAEIAAVLPVLVLLLAVVVAALSAGATAVRAVDAARAAAREIARGEPPEVARQAALRVLPGAEVSVDSDGREGVVRVHHVVRGRGVASFLVLPVSAEARAPLEPATPGAR